MDWYYADGEARKGPFKSMAFEQLIAAGTVAAGTMIWCDGMAVWERCDKAFLGKGRSLLSPSGEAKACDRCGFSYDSAYLVALAGQLICSDCKQEFYQSFRSAL